MSGKKVMLTIQGEKKEYPAGTSFLRIAQDYSDAYQDDIVLVLYNRRLRELNKCADGDGTVEFLTTADKTGVTLLMQKAVYNLWGKGNISVRVKYSIGQGNYCELVKWENDTEEVVKVSGTEINKLKNEMYQMVVSDIEIHKESINTDDAVTLFHDLGMTDKEKLFRYRRSSRVNIYELDHYMDYFYGFMVPSTGYLRYYDVIPYADGFMLQFPDKNTREVAPFVPAEKLFHTLKTSRDWGKMLEIDTIGALNDAIAAGKTQQMIELANEKVKTSNGNVVFIKKSHRNTTTLDFGVRAICMEDYPDILTMDEFIGFLYGMVAGNHDIDTIFIDSVLKQADISLNNISAFMTSLSKISAENTLDFFISVGAEKESIPDIDSDNYNVLN